MEVRIYFFDVLEFFLVPSDRLLHFIHDALVLLNLGINLRLGLARHARLQLVRVNLALLLSEVANRVLVNCWVQYL